MSTPLAGRLRERIDSQGPIPFSEFMETALYDPEEGYYADPAFTTGRQGDFATAPDAGPLMGATLAGPIGTFAHEPGRLIELGPGSGRLAEDVLSELEPEALQNLDVVLVEPHASRRERLEQRFDEAPGEVHVAEGIADLPPQRTFLIANEVLDALPCEVLRRSGSGFERLVVDAEGEGFQEAWEPAPSPVLDQVPEHARELPQGHRYELGLPLPGLVEEAIACLDPGVALFFDYGDTFEHVWPGKPDGTLRGFRGHEHAPPLSEPGTTDITYDVDFSRVMDHASRHGATVEAFGAQERLLVHLGLVRTAQQRGQLLSAKQLLVPGGFGGRFQALALGEGPVAEEVGLSVDLEDPDVWDRGLRDLEDEGGPGMGMGLVDPER